MLARGARLRLTLTVKFAPSDGSAPFAATRKLTVKGSAQRRWRGREAG